MIFEADAAYPTRRFGGTRDGGGSALPGASSLSVRSLRQEQTAKRGYTARGIPAHVSVYGSMEARRRGCIQVPALGAGALCNNAQGG